MNIKEKLAQWISPRENEICLVYNKCQFRYRNIKQDFSKIIIRKNRNKHLPNCGNMKEEKCRCMSTATVIRYRNRWTTLTQLLTISPKTESLKDFFESKIMRWRRHLHPHWTLSTTVSVFVYNQASRIRKGMGITETYPGGLVLL